MTSPTEPLKKELSLVLADLRVDPDLPVSESVHKAVQLARILQERGGDLQTPQERRQQRELERVMQAPGDKATLIQLTDQAFRPKRARRAADQLTYILDVQGVPRFFSRLERLMLKGFQSFGSYLPGVSMPLVKDRMRAETANAILPAEKEMLVPHLEGRRQHGVRMNVNFLGEALLGEADAQRRLEAYLAALQWPQIECISVKISTIYSQISAIARQRAIKELSERLELLYRAAAKGRFTRADGTVVPKFVYLDMEEFRDLSITIEAFMGALDRSGLEGVAAGIALQAYLPDSYPAQKQLNAWAEARVASGGAPVTLRLVKGANLEAERVEASIAGWPQAPYPHKAQTDANFKRMLHEGMAHIDAVHLGVASHNLFDLSYAMVLASERGVLDKVQLEMLEGMANHQRRALQEYTQNLLLYAPATKKEEFVNAIGYLIRRLDENSGPNNFLRHAFKLQVGDEAWTLLEDDFIKSFKLIDELGEGSRRTQNRSEPLGERPGPFSLSDFDNEPDTDFALPQNYAWAEAIIDRWRPRHGDAAAEIPLVVAGRELLDDRAVRPCYDPSRPGVVVGRYREASLDDLAAALDCARQDRHGWRGLSEAERGEILAGAAHELRSARGELIGAALADGGKIITESDPEISEAVDFVEYYAAAARELRALETVDVTPKGVVAVVSPWNFPIAIPCGGVSASLAAGNNVILKPASHSVLVAYELCKCFWRGGVPKEALQFMPCSGARVGSKLVASAEVDAVILTGGTDTALRMLEARPEMNLLAETGGKGATVVTGMSDREQAIKHLLHSAFSHSGQKCSATSMLVLEAEVYEDPKFKATLCDAVESLEVGSAWELDTKVGPLIHPPKGDLEVALKELEEGESWAVMPHPRDDNPALYSPAVKWGVRKGSYTHMTEFFGPVLAVLRAEGLDDAVDLVNHTGFGLTSGLESLDQREHEIWAEGIRAGNLYINRVTTGAVVLRQPFGGLGKSAFGPGIKAGGPNYVAQLMDFRDRPLGPVTVSEVGAPELTALQAALSDSVAGESEQSALSAGELDKILRAIQSYDAAFRREFGRDHDAFRLVGQDNIRRYRPVSDVRVRVHADDSPFELFARVCAAKTVGCRITVSLPCDHASAAVALLDELTEAWGASVELVEESDAELAEVVRRHQTDRVRYARPDRVPRSILEAVGDSGVFIARSPVLVEGRVELLWYVYEQSISYDYHRYGNLGGRSDEERRPVS